MTTAGGDPTDACNNLALRKAARYLGATYDKALAPSGLRATQFTILQKLNAHGELTIGGLADAMAMDRTTMASNLKPSPGRAWSPSSSRRATAAPGPSRSRPTAWPG
ncbi:MarR family winged helix-turn-helix transcriptional regulator [Catellatospora coxensis]